MTRRENLPPRLRAVLNGELTCSACGQRPPATGSHRRCWQCSRTGDGTARRARAAAARSGSPAGAWNATSGCARRSRHRGPASPASRGEYCPDGSARPARSSAAATRPGHARAADARRRSAAATAGCATARPSTWPGPRRGTPAPSTSLSSGRAATSCSSPECSLSAGTTGATPPVRPRLRRRQDPMARPGGRRSSFSLSCSRCRSRRPLADPGRRLAPARLVRAPSPRRCPDERATRLEPEHPGARPQHLAVPDRHPARRHPHLHSQRGRTARGRRPPQHGQDHRAAHRPAAADRRPPRPR